MAKYQKKVVQIEAYKLGSENAPEWFEDAIISGKLAFQPLTNYLELITPKGRIRGYRGDYLILNEDGSLYLCKRTLFEATYEPSYGDEDEEISCGDPIPEIGEDQEPVEVQED